jgi:predicted amidohydrolase
MPDAVMPAKENLNVAVYQSALANASPEDKLRGIDHALTRHDGADILVCPELFMSGYGAGEKLADLAEAFDGNFAQHVGEIARRRNASIVYGYPEAFDGGIYNSAVAIGKDGTFLGNHRKMVMPTGYEKQWFSRGEALTMFDVDGWNIALIICYELEFPEIVRACSVRGADLVVVPTALTHEWDLVSRQMVPARAFENGIYLAYSNHCGNDGDIVYLGESCIVGPDGRDLARAGRGEGVIGATLDATAFAAARSRLAYLTDSETLVSLRETGVATHPVAQPE